MRLASIISLFDGEELLVGSMRTVKDQVDLFIIVHQDVSNHGELYNALKNLPEDMDDEFPILWIQYHPTVDGIHDEVRKRNAGINAARNHGCTHFLFMDVDEYYMPGEFAEAKQQFINAQFKESADGSVIELYTYFGKPTLRHENPDNYLVPFIHEIKDSTSTGMSAQYPYYVDPTRKVKCDHVIKITGVYMHHYSWIRASIERKIRNSSARAHIERSNLLNEYRSAQAGSLVDGGKKLISVPDYFEISKMIDKFTGT